MSSITGLGHVHHTREEWQAIKAQRTIDQAQQKEDRKAATEAKHGAWEAQDEIQDAHEAEMRQHWLDLKAARKAASGS